jgi:hypothetical protein
MVRICSAGVMCRSIRVSTTVLLFRVSELGFEARSGLKDGPEGSNREFLSPPSPALTTLLCGREVSEYTELGLLLYRTWRKSWFVFSYKLFPFALM